MNVATGVTSATSLSARKTPATRRNAADTARPPARGTGTVLIRRASGWSTIS